MARIVFIMSHASHQNSTFGLAKRLLARQHQVVYAGPELGIDGDDLARNARNQGYDYEVFNPYQAADQLPAAPNETAGNDSFHTFLRNLVLGTVFTRFAEKMAPDLILLDIHNPLYIIVFSALRIPTVFISTQILTDRDDFAPPLEFAMIPDGTESSRKMIAHAWEGRLQYNRLPADLRSFLSEVAAQYNFPFEELLDTEKSIVPFGFKLPEVVLWPYEFDFPRTESRLVGKFYVGSPLDLGRHQNNWDWQEVAGDKPIIYCAMGTRFSDKKVRFLEKLISLFAGLPQYQLIIGAAHYFPLPARLNLPDNVRVVDNAPQLTILKKARLMITHCGGNSLKECIIMGVPVLCYPHDNDQFGNAARVQYHRIGLSGDIVADEPDVIKEKIISILHDQGMKEQIQKFRALFARYEQSDVATEVVESFLRPVG